jgi:hypothetical protein
MNGDRRSQFACSTARAFLRRARVAETPDECCFKTHVVFTIFVTDPQSGVVQDINPRTAMCVRNVDVHVSCSSHVDALFAAFFIDPQAK